MQELAHSNGNGFRESLAIHDACEEMLKLKTEKLKWPTLDARGQEALRVSLFIRSDASQILLLVLLLGRSVRASWSLG
jgi:hypothetical protein